MRGIKCTSTRISVPLVRATLLLLSSPTKTLGRRIGSRLLPNQPHVFVFVFFLINTIYCIFYLSYFILGHLTKPKRFHLAFLFTSLQNKMKKKMMMMIC